MGVPAFFRWLSRKYASIVVNCNEEKPRIVDGVKTPVDSSKPNPNDIEFDNLYLDMNGIIHPCCHPEDKPAPKNEDEMMVDIFAYIDRIFAIVRPRRLLYMAIDGVAPRAKMNQQRSRRFRAAKESIEQREEIAAVKEQLRAKGMNVLPDKKPEEHFDSNCITPGTPFMHRLAKCLRYYVHDRLNSDPGWKNIAVILSDANVPGEGEHKIMDYIRRQRAQPDHDPNTHHCLCGADADLIMLGLATHEPNFTIIREEFKPNQPRPCAVCGQMGHEIKECTGTPKDQKSEDAISKLYSEQEFIFLRLCVLREYLEKELDIPNLPFKQDFERAIDDWVFMCFFVGNDFLPHLPSLEIREGAIDRLVRMYKTAVYKTGGYLTNSGVVNLTRVQLVLSELGEAEDQIFKKRRESDLDFNRRNKDRRKRAKMMSNANAPRWIPGGQFAPKPIGSAGSVIQNPRQAVSEGRKDKGGDSSNSATSPGSAPTKRKADDVDSDDEPEPFDEVKLWEDGWKDRYYESKFNVGTADEDFKHLVANEYVLGLCWVLAYYYQGCPSWKWYFPYHYAPFASDFINIGDVNTDFEKDTQPFKPLEQLMGVFPAASQQFLPPTWQTLMCHEESAIIDFYPTNFKIDLNGKKYAWQGVALLPFVDETRLKETLSTVYPDLSEDEMFRNKRGNDRLVVGKQHPAHDFLEGLYEGDGTLEPTELTSSLINGMGGKIWSDKFVVLTGQTLASPVPQLQDLKDNTAISIQFSDPQFERDYLFPATVLPGAKFPPKVLKPEDFELAARGGRGGRGGRGRGRGGDRGRGWGGGRGGYRPQIGFTRDSGYRRSESKDVAPLLRNIGAHMGSQAAGGGAPSLMSMGSYGGQESRSGGYGGGYGGSGRYGNAAGGRQDQTYDDRYGQRGYGGGGSGASNYGQNVYGSYSSSSYQPSSGGGYSQQYQQNSQVYGSYSTSTGQGQSNQNYQRDGRSHGDRSRTYPRPPTRRY